MAPLLGGGFLAGQGNGRIRARESRAPRQAGFSLMEALIVVALVGLMAVMAVPWFLKVSQRGQLRSDAYQIQAALMGARMSAVKRNSPATVSIVIAPSTDTEHEIDTVYGTIPDPPPPTPTPVPVVPKFFIGAKRIDFVQTPVGGVITFRGDGTREAPAPTGPDSNARFIVAGPTGRPLAQQNQITIETQRSGRVVVITPVNWK